MTDTVKMRFTGERADIKAMITVLDPLLDIVTDWRIFPQRTGSRVSAYLEARPRTEGSGAQSAAADDEGDAPSSSDDPAGPEVDER